MESTENVVPAENPAPETPKQPEMEVIPFPKLTQLAIRELQKNLDVSLNEIVQETANILNVKPQDGWQFNLQNGVFFRQVAPKA